MRIELKHRAKSLSSENLRQILEEIIAEERLPIVIELNESEDCPQTCVRIHASGWDSAGLHQDFHPGESGPDQRSDALSLIEQMRELVLEKWHDYSKDPLSHLI